MPVKYNDDAVTTLASSLSAVALTCSVSSSSTFPTLSTGEYFYTTIIRASDNAKETIKITNVSGTTWTIVRAQGSGESALAFLAGDAVELRVGANLIEDISVSYFKSENYTSLAEAIGAAAAKTLVITNQFTPSDNLTASNLTITILQGGSIEPTTGKIIDLGNCTVNAGYYKIFGGAGIVKGDFLARACKAEWYGMVANGSTDNYPFWQVLKRAAESEGTLDLVFGSGIFKFTTGDIDLDLDLVKPIIRGHGWMHTFLWHTAASINGGLYLHGTGQTISGQLIANNGSWFEIKDLSVGSETAHAILIYRCGMNPRIKDVWIFEAGTSDVFLRGVGVSTFDISFVRFGPGNMSQGNSTDHPAIATISPFTTPANFVYIDAGTSVFSTECKLYFCQGHANITGHGVILEQSSASAAAFFDMELWGNAFKVAEAVDNQSSYYLDGVNAMIYGGFSEEVNSGSFAGLPYAITLKSTYGRCRVRVIGFEGNNGGILIDRSGSGGDIDLELIGGSYAELTESGATCDFNVSSTDVSWGTIPSSTIFQHFEANKTLADYAIFAGSRTKYSSGVVQRLNQTNATSSSGVETENYKTRGTYASPSNISANDIISTDTHYAYLNGAKTLHAQQDVKVVEAGTTGIGHVIHSLRNGASLVDAFTEVPKMSGTVTITGAADSATVALGYTDIDTSYKVVVTPITRTGGASAGSTRVLAVNKTSTTFVIYVEAAPGVGETVTLDWWRFR